MSIRTAIWQQALDSQSASNLSGLARFLVRALDELQATGIKDTDDLNTHPVVRLVVAQLSHLAYGTFDCGAGDLWLRAYHLAEVETASVIVPSKADTKETPMKGRK
ncbi:MAG: hypothetical protein U0941_16035 [Planctomycetaceae bacterium]